MVRIAEGRAVVAPKTSVTAPASAQDLSKAQLQAAARFVNRCAASEGSEFPQFGSGNCGIIAGIVAGEPARVLLNEIGDMLSTSKPLSSLLPGGVLDPAKQALIVVADSEDEVSVHLSVLDLGSNKVSKLGFANTVDLANDDFEDGYERMAKLLESSVVLDLAQDDGAGVSGLFPGR